MKQTNNRFMQRGSLSWAIVLVLLIVTISACKPKEKSLPQPHLLLTEQQLTQILVDVHLAEGVLNYKRNLGLSFDENKNVLYNEVFAQHGITSKILESNLLYYNDQPEIMEKIYEEVINHLSKEQVENTPKNE